MSRWPIRRESSLAFGSARVQFAELSGPRGLIQVYGLVMDAWWFDESQSRQDAVRALLSYVHQAQDKRAPLIICGDFNADPDSDEIRMLTGRTTVPARGLSFYDAWEVAGLPSPGHTWSNNNPWGQPAPVAEPPDRLHLLRRSAPGRRRSRDTHRPTGHPLR